MVTVKIDVRALLKKAWWCYSRASFRVFKNGDMDWFVDGGQHRKGCQVQREVNTYHYRGFFSPLGCFDLLIGSIRTISPPIPSRLQRLSDTQRDEV